MTQPEYEQKKRECWEEFCKDNGLHADGKMFAATDKDFSQLIDRAYALGKLQACDGQVKETITQAEIDQVAEEYADPSRTWASGAETQEIKDAFKAGANFALGKQDKDAEDTVISGWVARGEVADCPRLYNHKPFRKKEGFKDGLWSYGLEIGLRLDPSLFPDITWESDPEPVEITIKRKNHE